MSKTFVTVMAEHDTNGQMRPLSLKWTNGKVYSIDRILDIRQAASLKAGGCGIRYTCRIANREIYLFNDEGKWFVEKWNRVELHKIQKDFASAFAKAKSSCSPVNLQL